MSVRENRRKSDVYKKQNNLNSFFLPHGGHFGIIYVNMLNIDISMHITLN